jgi:hypothetical protein
MHNQPQTYHNIVMNKNTAEHFQSWWNYDTPSDLECRLDHHASSITQSLLTQLHRHYKHNFPTLVTTRLFHRFTVKYPEGSKGAINTMRTSPNSAINTTRRMGSCSGSSGWKCRWKIGSVMLCLRGLWTWKQKIRMHYDHMEGMFTSTVNKLSLYSGIKPKRCVRKQRHTSSHFSEPTHTF